MEASNFVVTEHWSPCQLVREYPRAVKRDDAELFLAVKEYRPRNHSGSEDDAVTIIASPGNGFPKECYEPLFDELLNAANGFKIRAIWIADFAHQGASYARNAASLGDDPCWNDHSRDLLLMVNHFRGKMKPPFVGLGHSMGASQIANLALLHPRLFHSVAFIDPVILNYHPPGPNAAMFTSLRRERWDSRATAEASMSKNPLFKSWDARVFKVYLQFALTDLDDGSVVLTTPKTQEAWTFLRGNFSPVPEDTTTTEARYRERLFAPDLVPFSRPSIEVFARGDSLHVYESLHHLRPNTLFVYGARSHINHSEHRKKHLERTGAGRGGNGGVNDGGTQWKIVDSATHLVPFERPALVARDISEWLTREIARWRKEKEFWANFDFGKSKNGMKEFSDRWIAGVKEKTGLLRPKAKDSAKL